MASLWYKDLQHHWNIQTAVEENNRQIKDIQNEMDWSCGDKSRFGHQIDRMEGLPFVLSIPNKNKKVSFLHHFHWDRDKDDLLGLEGFSPNPHSASAKLDDLCAPLVGRVAEEIAEIRLPSADQMLKALTEKEMLSLEGTSGLYVKDFQDDTKSLIWSPKMLWKQDSAGKDTPAIKLLMSMTHTLLANQNDEDDNPGTVETYDPGFPSWETHLQYLWVVAKGWNQPTKLAEPSDPPEKFVKATMNAWRSVISNADELERKKGNPPSDPTTRDSEARDEDNKDHRASTGGKRGDGPKTDEERGAPPDHESSKRRERDESSGYEHDRGEGRRTHGNEKPRGKRNHRRGHRERSRSRSDSDGESLGGDRSEPDNDRRGRSRSRGTQKRGYQSDGPSTSEDESSPSRASTRRRDYRPRNGTHGQGRRDKRRHDPSPSDPSSSDSSSDEGHSDDPERRRRARRRRRKRARRASRKKDHDAILRESLQELAFNTRAQNRKDRDKDSMLRAWTRTNKNLFRMLSARDYRERGLPRLGSFASTLTWQKGIHRASQLVQEEARSGNWLGDVLRGILSGDGI